MSARFYADVLKKDDEISNTHSNMFRLTINTVAYMNCFPDRVADGGPKDYFDYSENKLAKNLTFQVSEKIKEGENLQSSKIPRFRKGHFRSLLSDYFTNKKEQVIFVAETMVNGKAKTISTSEDLDVFYTDKKINR